MSSRDLLKLMLGLVGWSSFAATVGLVSSIMHGRVFTGTGTDWMSSAVITLLFMMIIMSLACWTRYSLGHRISFLAAGLPLLFLVDSWPALLSIYIDDRVNHLIVTNMLSKSIGVNPEIHVYVLTKFVILALVWGIWPLWARRGANSVNFSLPAIGLTTKSVPVLIIAVVGTMYLRINILEPLQHLVPSDLRVNFLGALAIREGLNPYDNLVALNLARNEAMPYSGTETWNTVTNPPTAMPFFALLTYTPVQVSTVLFLGLNNLLLIGLFWILHRMLKPAVLLWWVLATLTIVVAYQPLTAAMSLGQVDIIIAFLLLVSAYGIYVRKLGLAGFVVGIAAALKISPGLIVLYFVWRGYWRAVAGMAFSGALMIAISFWMVGLDTWTYYVTERLPDLLSGTGLWQNLSVLGLINRSAIGTNVAIEYWGLLPSVSLIAILNYFAVAAILASMVLVLRTQQPRKELVILEFGIVIAALLLVSGVSWPHYAVWLLPVLSYLVEPRVWPSLTSQRTVVLASVGLGVGLLCIPFPEYSNTMLPLFKSSVIMMSLRGLGLFFVYIGLAGLYMATPITEQSEQSD